MRSRGGRWHLRIDDLDRERCVPGLSESFPATLEEFGFEWDGNIQFQSDRTEAYHQALERLRTSGCCYACRCSRASIVAALAVEPGSEPVYPGTCRGDVDAGKVPHALRFAIAADQAPVTFQDAFQGTCRQDCRLESGDFIVKRRDGFIAYHLAVVVDDAFLGVTEVVRGADLLSSTPRQILLQRALGLPTPRYGHLPVLTEPDGRKLAKSRHALPLSAAERSQQLWQVLAWLEQSPPPELMRAPVREQWSWALRHWQPDRLVGIRERRLPPAA